MEDPSSVLPKDILQHILSFLSDQEAGRTSVLSKSWFEAWSTIPDLFLNQLIFVDHYDRRHSCSIENKEKFLNFVDSTMARREKHNIPINKFCLFIFINDEKSASLVDQWIRKAIQCGVKEVSLRLDFPPSNSSSSFASLLRNVFSTKELVALDLFYCEVKKHILDGMSFDFRCLRRLTIYDTPYFDEDYFQKCISCCVSIEVLTVYRCQGLQTIRVSNLPKLKFLHVNTCPNQMVIVDAPNVEKLTYGCLNGEDPFLLDVKESHNVKKLVLTNTSITDECFHKLIAKFPLLEKLVVKWCDMIQRINVSSHSLNVLHFRSCLGLVDAKIDSPNLRLFRYYGNSIPTFSLTSDKSKRRCSIYLNCCDRLDDSWFHNLNEFLKMLSPSDKIKLFIETEEISLTIAEDLRKSKSELNILHLTVCSCSPLPTYVSIMDALLWSCSPKFLNLRCETYEDGNFIDYQELMKGYAKKVKSYNCSNDGKSCLITFNC